MDTHEKRQQLEKLASEIFELTKLIYRARALTRADAIELLTETESLALELLSKNEVMSVGEIQKSVGVLPAQMSRIVRALEDKGGEAYISCSINPNDRRRIDVSLTDAGKKALQAYRNARLASIMKILSILDVTDRDEFMRMLRKIHKNISNTIENK